MKKLYLLLLIVFFTACGKDEFTYTITYRLESTADGVDISYYDHNTNDFEEVDNVSGNWQKSFTYTTDSTGDVFGYISAFNGPDYDVKKITVKILLNNRVVKERSCEERRCFVSASY